MIMWSDIAKIYNEKSAYVYMCVYMKTVNFIHTLP